MGPRYAHIKAEHTHHKKWLNHHSPTTPLTTETNQTWNCLQCWVGDTRHEKFHWIGDGITWPYTVYHGGCRLGHRENPTASGCRRNIAGNDYRRIKSRNPQLNYGGYILGSSHRHHHKKTTNVIGQNRELFENSSDAAHRRLEAEAKKTTQKWDKWSQLMLTNTKRLQRRMHQTAYRNTWEEKKSVRF